ncbi:mg966 protein [Acanthamoeba polyphaga mimivirus]|nr:mg966 protein [Mimivirus reunion]WMV61369.1 mg966 protein [Mimivirus sp.]WMV62346.1 mg966 protein [Acanthamoeba polyphaga mimivirus]WMV63323.1 mg966 protein [Mimivirus sp.]
MKNMNTTNFLVTLVVLLSVSVSMAQLSIESPIIEYDKEFVIYSVAWNSYCRVPLNDIAFKCDLGLTNINQATRFAINDGSSFGYPVRTGPVVSGSSIPNILYESTGSWNEYQRVAYVPSLNNPSKTILLTFQQSLSDNVVIFQFNNKVQQSDNYLHGNVTEINFKDMTRSNGWCSGQPSYQNGGYTQCDRSAVQGWEVFRFIPV